MNLVSWTSPAGIGLIHQFGFLLAVWIKSANIIQMIYVSFVSNLRSMRKAFSIIFLLYAITTFAQEKPLDMKMDFEEYDPPSSLVVEEHHLTKSKFPFIDIHNKIPKFSNCLFTTLVKLLCDNVNFLLCSVFLLFGYQHSLALPWIE